MHARHLDMVASMMQGAQELINIAIHLKCTARSVVMHGHACTPERVSVRVRKLFDQDEAAMSEGEGAEETGRESKRSWASEE